jgi:co-chaperonin GroES (HSP10)
MNHNALTETPSLPFRPLRRLVFIKPEIEEQIGSFWIPRVRRDMPDRGTVMALSDEAAKELPDVKVGDRVLIKKQMQFLADDQKCTVVDWDYVLALL